jgi:hypothetical protein
MVVTGWSIVPALGGRRMTSSALPQLKAPAARDGVLISGAGSQRLGDLDCMPLARFAPIRDLLLCAKHLFVAARTAWARQEAAALRDFDQAHVRLGSKADK